MNRTKIEWADYEAGYITGVTLGDGTMRRTPKTIPYRTTQRYWRVALKSTAILERLQTYLAHLNVHVELRRFSTPTMRKLETRQYDKIEKIHKLMHLCSTIDFKRGFIAGIYDAEGNCYLQNLRIYNYDQELRKRIIKYAKSFGFEFYVEDYPSKKGNGVRLRGGNSERERFFETFMPIKEMPCNTQK